MNNQKKWIIMFILVLFAMLFSWYFFIYVENREEMLNEKGYRILERLSININEKVKSYQNSLKYYKSISNEKKPKKKLLSNLKVIKDSIILDKTNCKDLIEELSKDRFSKT